VWRPRCALPLSRLGQPALSDKVASLLLPTLFANSKYSSLAPLVVSLSNGQLALLRPNEVSGLSVANTWHAHDYEPWVAAWNYWDTNVIYSGAPHLSGVKNEDERIALQAATISG
jgi:hypothetical protein